MLKGFLRVLDTDLTLQMLNVLSGWYNALRNLADCAA